MSDAMDNANHKNDKTAATLDEAMLLSGNEFKL